MSKDTTEELFDLTAMADSKPKTVRKTPVVKSASKKVAAKKTVVRKVAKKAPAARSKASEETGSTPEEKVAPAPSTPPEPKATSTAGQAPSESFPPPSPRSENDHSMDRQEDDQPRVGRVPGGGPVNQNEGQQPVSRSKKRRDKRKRRRDQTGEPHQQSRGHLNQSHTGERRDRNERGDRFERNERNDRIDRNDRNERPQEDRSPIVLSGELTATDGVLEMTQKGFGFLRLAEGNFEQAKEDIFISPDVIRRHSLRQGQWLHGMRQSSNRGPQLVEITSVNGMPPDEAAKLPHFDELKAINPNKRISFETTPDRYTTRVIDIVSPVGRGQRGLIVSPPRSGKTTLLLHMAEAIREKYDEQIHLMVLLVDERPEEVTEFRRALPGAEIYASSNDENPRNHCRIAELAIERAKRLVEAGQDVFLLMDSITRLARAYNGAMSGGKGRSRATGSGGIMIGALEIPRRLFAAARNTRGGGSLTILATALIQTNSRADEAIFMEFKGTGNMELVLDRKIAESYIYPAVDIFRSGTRREELLLPEHTLHKIHLIRRGLSGHKPYEAMERLLYFVKKFPNNPQMLMEIKG